MANSKRDALFRRTGRPRREVHLKWRRDVAEFRCFAEAFQRVAQDALSAARTDPLCFRAITEFRAIPIVALYRHALELHLKAVILAGRGMVELTGGERISEGRVTSTHDLKELGGFMLRVFAAFGWEWEKQPPRVFSRRNFESILRQFQERDPGDAFRYPWPRVDPKPISFDVFEFCSKLDTLFLALSNASLQAHEDLQDEYVTRSEGAE